MATPKRKTNSILFLRLRGAKPRVFLRGEAIYADPQPQRLLGAQRKLLEPHDFMQLILQAQLGIGHAALPTAKCRICRFHIDAEFLAKFHWTGQIK